MLGAILTSRNLNQAILRVLRNNGSCGVDGMEVSSLIDHLREAGADYIVQIQTGSYQPSAIRGVEIPKSNGKVGLLGIPTVVDRVIQQAIQQVLSPIFERDFLSGSYGFRPGRNAHEALASSLEYINSGYQDVVDIDLKSFFDEVDHGLILELVYKKVKCRGTLGLIRKFLRAPILKDGVYQKRRKGLPQEDRLDP